MYKYFFKRFFDFWIALIALICISPLLLVVTIWLHFANKDAGGGTSSKQDGTQEKSVRARFAAWFAPVLFFQERPGLHGKIFKVVKFKTMTDEKDANGELLPDEDRLTKVGNFVRSTSIDELPQLFNVLKGDMALIGPRPLLVKYLPLYSKEQMRRHEVRPGITGWAQCHGRNELSWTKKFQYDVWYVDHLSFLTDLKVIWYTIKTVVKREGISHEGMATMEAFNGNN